MKLSIIVPVYKTQAYLRACIDSVLKQSFDDLELILVDDGSPDGSGAICDTYAHDSRVQVIHKENGGVSSARRMGAEQATGEYVLFLDSDDCLAPDFLEQLAPYLAQKPDAILFDGMRMAGVERFCTALAPGLYGRELQENLILSRSHEPIIGYGVTMKVVRRSDYLPHCHVPQGLYRGEDMAVSVPLLAACDRVYVTDLCGYLYRDTPESVMNTFREDGWQQIVLLADHLQAVLPEVYWDRIDALAAKLLFDYADRAMVSRSFACYRTLAKTAAAALAPRLGRFRSRCPHIRERLVLWLTKHRCFTAIWLLRKLKPRR